LFEQIMCDLGTPCIVSRHAVITSAVKPALNVLTVTQHGAAFQRNTNCSKIHSVYLPDSASVNPLQKSG